MRIYLIYFLQDECGLPLENAVCYLKNIWSHIDNPEDESTIPSKENDAESENTNIDSDNLDKQDKNPEEQNKYFISLKNIEIVLLTPDRLKNMDDISEVCQ